MKIIHTPEEWKKIRSGIASDKKVGFVPTMGGLHNGHLSLVQKCHKENDISVVSVYLPAFHYQLLPPALGTCAPLQGGCHSDSGSSSVIAPDRPLYTLHRQTDSQPAFRHLLRIQGLQAELLCNHGHSRQSI